VSAEVFETFDRASLAALQAREIPRVRAVDYLAKNDEDDAEADTALARWDAYFSQFAKLTDARCLCCGTSLRCRLRLGVFGGFTWGLAHGEGHCSTCGYPMRGHHSVEDLGTICNLFLAHHPSTLSFPVATMAVKRFDDECPGCRPAMINGHTKQPYPDASAEITIVNRLWAETMSAEREVWHRVTCQNSRSIVDVQLAQRFADRVQVGLLAVSLKERSC